MSTESTATEAYRWARRAIDIRESLLITVMIDYYRDKEYHQ